MKKQVLRTMIVAIAMFVQTQLFGQTATLVNFTTNPQHTAITFNFSISGIDGAFEPHVVLTGPNYNVTLPNPMGTYQGNPYIFSVTFTGTQPSQVYNWFIGVEEVGNGNPVATNSGQITSGCVQPTIAFSNQQPDNQCVNHNGSVKATASGGTAPYTYLWSNGVTGQNVFNLAAGAYNVTVTDFYGCQQTAGVQITSTAVAPTISSINIANVSCNGGSNGMITVYPTGGTFPYTYAWSNGGNTNTINNLSAGSYTVTVTGANGCSVTSSFTVNQPTQLTSTIASQTNETCYNSNNGTAIMVASGGTPPYTYSGWTNTNGSYQNLQAGSPYNFTVTDSKGCVSTQMVTITQPTEMSVAVSMTNVTCYGMNDGQGQATVTGGTAPYTYLWSNGTGITTPHVTGLAPGSNYQLTVTDANGCSETRTFLQVTQPLYTLNTSEAHTNVTSFGGSNGSVNLSVTGGTMPYSYLWSDGSTSEDISNLTGGIYSVTVTDARGCTATRSITITTPGQTVDHFGVQYSNGNGIPTQYVDSLFTIQIIAYDAANNIVTGFNGTVNLQGLGNPTPQMVQGSGTSGSFNQGQLINHNVEIHNTGLFQLKVTQTGGTAVGWSNYFTVDPRVPPAFTGVTLVDTVPRNYSQGRYYELPGTGFRPGIQGKVNGTNVSTTYISATQVGVLISPMFFSTPQTLVLTATNSDGQTTTNSLTIEVFDWVAQAEIIGLSMTSWPQLDVTVKWQENFYETAIKLQLQCSSSMNNYADVDAPIITNDVTGLGQRVVFTDPDMWVYVRYEWKVASTNQHVLYTNYAQFYTFPYDVGIEEAATELVDGGTVMYVVESGTGRRLDQFTGLEFGPNKPLNISEQLTPGVTYAWMIQANYAMIPNAKTPTEKAAKVYYRGQNHVID